MFPYYDGILVENNRVETVDRIGIKLVRHVILEDMGDDDRLANSTDSGGEGIHYNAARGLLPEQIEAKSGERFTRNLVIRNNDLSDIGGDGILVMSCRGALVENNLLYNHTMRSTVANAGIWPWNSVDPVFWYNESYANCV